MTSMSAKIWAAGAALTAAAFGLSWAASAQTAGVASAGIYSKAQLDRGAALYADNCARCHGGSMEGLDVAPPLTGQRFLGNWTNQPVGELVKRIRTTMPLDMPGSLGVTASTEIAADLLAANGYPAGQADLPTTSGDQQAIMIDAPPGK